MSSTAEQIFDWIIEHTPLGSLYTLTAGATTSITDDQELKGPHPSGLVPRGAPIRVRDIVDSATDAIEDTWADVYNPSTGQVTVEPDLAMTPAASDVAEIWIPELFSPSRILEKVNIALTQDCGAWTPFVLTLVTDGDMEMAHADIATSWTGTNSTVSKVTATGFPHRFGRQMLFVNNSAASGYGYAYVSVNVVPLDSYMVNVLGRAVVSTVSLAVYDEDGTDDITLQATATDTTEHQWVMLRSSFAIPTDCYRITPRLGGASATADTYWTQLSITRQGDTRISLPARITSEHMIGRVFQRYGNEVDNFSRGPDLEYDVEAVEDGFDLILPSGVLGSAYPAYAEEWRPYDSLADYSESTTCDLEYVGTFAVYRLYLDLWQQEENRRGGSQWTNKWTSLLGLWSAAARAMNGRHAGPTRMRTRFPGGTPVAQRV